MSAPRDVETRSQSGSRTTEERVQAWLRGAPAKLSKVFRGEGLLELLTVLTLIGGCLLILADFLDLFRIEAAGLTVSTQSGGSQHAYAQLVIGIAVIGATMLGRSTRQWPPGAAVVALAAIALAIALIGDLPEATRSDLVRGGRVADASPAVGFWVELVGAAVTLASGAAETFLLRALNRDTRNACRGCEPSPGGVLGRPHTHGYAGSLRPRLARFSPPQTSRALRQGLCVATSGSARRPCWPGPCGRCRPCACRPRPAARRHP
jgi:hypothetical protein